LKTSSLDVFNDLGGFLPLAEVDQVRPNHVGIFVNKRELRQEDACKPISTGLSAPNIIFYSPMNGTQGATMVESLCR
jgi:hypothetical protein